MILHIKVTRLMVKVETEAKVTDKSKVKTGKTAAQGHISRLRSEEEHTVQRSNNHELF